MINVIYFDGCHSAISDSSFSANLFFSVFAGQSDSEDRDRPFEKVSALFAFYCKIVKQVLFQKLAHLLFRLQFKVMLHQNKNYSLIIYSP